jgi:hypothetical protein
LHGYQDLMKTCLVLGAWHVGMQVLTTQLRPDRESRRCARAGGALARRHRASFVDYQQPAHQVFAMAYLNGVRRRVVVADLDEPEPPRLAGESGPA